MSTTREEKMRKALLIVIGLLLASIFARAQGSGAAQHHHSRELSVAAAGQDWARQRLEKSPRHQEWIQIHSGSRTVNSFIVYPEVKSKGMAVVVIHEIFGMTDWVRSVADQLAEAGYIAIAPDLLSGMGPNGGGTNSFTDRSAIGQAFRDLPPD